MIHVLAMITAKPGKRAGDPGAISAPTCRRCTPSTAASNTARRSTPRAWARSRRRSAEDTFVVIEKWESLDALKAHGAAPHMAAYAGEDARNDRQPGHSCADAGGVKGRGRRYSPPGPLIYFPEPAPAARRVPSPQKTKVGLDACVQRGGNAFPPQPSFLAHQDSSRMNAPALATSARRPAASCGWNRCQTWIMSGQISKRHRRPPPRRLSRRRPQPSSSSVSAEPTCTSSGGSPCSSAYKRRDQRCPRPCRAVVHRGDLPQVGLLHDRVDRGLAGHAGRGAFEVHPGADQPGAARQRQALVAQRQQRRGRQPAAGAVAADGDACPARSRSPANGGSRRRRPPTRRGRGVPAPGGNPAQASAAHPAARLPPPSAGGCRASRRRSRRHAGTAARATDRRRAPRSTRRGRRPRASARRGYRPAADSCRPAHPAACRRSLEFRRAGAGGEQVADHLHLGVDLACGHAVLPCRASAWSDASSTRVAAASASVARIGIGIARGHQHVRRHRGRRRLGRGAPGSAAVAKTPGRRVLLLEAGRDWRAAEAPHALRSANIIPFMHDPAHQAAWQWPGLMTRRTAAQAPKFYWRGKALGGSSAVNAQIAIRGVPAAFDAWAEAGCEGWAASRRACRCIDAIEDDAETGVAPGIRRGGPLPVHRASRSANGALVDSGAARCGAGRGVSVEGRT